MMMTLANPASRVKVSVAAAAAGLTITAGASTWIDPRVPLALAAVVVIVTLTAQAPVASLALVLLSSFLSVPVLIYKSVDVYPQTLLVPLLLGCLLLGIGKRRDLAAADLPGFRAMRLVILVSLLSIAYSYVAWDPHVPTGSTLETGHRWIGYQAMGSGLIVLVFGGYIAGALLVRSRKDVRPVLLAALLPMLYFIVPTIGAWLMHPRNPVAAYASSVSAGGSSRPDIPYTLAAFTAVLAFAYLLHAERARDRALWSVLLGIGLVGVFASYFLNSWVAVIATLTVMMLRASKRLLIVGGIALLPVYLYVGPLVATVVSQRASGDDVDRLTLWRDAIHIWSTSPIIGIGSGNFVSYTEAYSSFSLSLVLQGYHQAHNNFLELLAEQGIVGMLLICIVIVSIVRYLFQAVDRQPTPEMRAFVLGAAGVFVCSAVMSFFSSGFIPTVSSAGWDTFPTDVRVWILAGVAVGVTRVDALHRSVGPMGGRERDPEEWEGG